MNVDTRQFWNIYGNIYTLRCRYILIKYFSWYFGWLETISEILSEILKASLRACIFVWTVLLAAICNNEKVPKDWTRGILVKIFKERDAQICDNWRGINLTSVPRKILASVMLQLLRAAIDSHLREEQYGFWPGRSSSGLIFILILMVEESREWNKKLYLLFVDFERAFESVNESVLMDLMENFKMLRSTL